MLPGWSWGINSQIGNKQTISEMDVSSHAAIASAGTCPSATYWLKLWFCWLQERSGSRPQQRKHCTPTAATVSVPAPQSSHLKFNITGPIPPYSSNQWPALWRGDAAVCWEEGDRWETGIAVYVSVWVSVSEGWEGGWLKGGGRLRLGFSHTDTLSHTSDELKTVCIDMQKSGRFRGRVIHGCVEGGILKTQISLPTALAQRSPASAATPSPFI